MMRMRKIAFFVGLAAVAVMFTGCLEDVGNKTQAWWFGTVEIDTYTGEKSILLDNMGISLVGNIPGSNLKDGDRVVVDYTIDYDSQPSNAGNTYTAQFNSVRAFDTSLLVAHPTPADTAIIDTLNSFYGSLGSIRFPFVTYYKDRKNVVTVMVGLTTTSSTPDYKLNLVDPVPYAGENADTLILTYTQYIGESPAAYNVFHSFTLPDYGDKKVNVVIKYKADPALSAQPYYRTANFTYQTTVEQ